MGLNESFPGTKGEALVHPGGGHATDCESVTRSSRPPWRTKRVPPSYLTQPAMQGGSGEDRPDGVALLDAGEPHVESLLPERQPAVVDAQAVQDRRVQV